MNLERKIFPKMMFLVSLISTQVAFAGIKKDDLNIGVTQQGRLAVAFSPDEPIPLSPINGFLSGWASDEPGFFSVAAALPPLNLSPLDSAAIIEMEVVRLDPAFQAWTPGFGEVLQQPGDRWIIGAPPFDAHLFWHVDSTSMVFDPTGYIYTATFVLRDNGTTGYAASDPLTIAFTRVPEPAVLFLIGAGFIGILGARRSGDVKRGAKA